jgi:DNA-binding NtrC family response regulator
MSNDHNILIVEDDDDSRRGLQRFLEAEGYRVELAANGHQTLVSDRFNEFAAVFLDRSLADGTAGALLVEIKGVAPATDVVVMTDGKDACEAISAMQHGAADFLVKPVQPFALLVVLERLARLKDAEQRATEMKQRATDAERRAEEVERLAEIGQRTAVLAHEARNELHQLAICLSLLRCNASGEAEFWTLLPWPTKRKAIWRDSLTTCAAMAGAWL